MLNIINKWQLPESIKEFYLKFEEFKKECKVYSGYKIDNLLTFSDSQYNWCFRENEITRKRLSDDSYVTFSMRKKRNALLLEKKGIYDVVSHGMITYIFKDGQACVDWLYMKEKLL